MQPSPRQNIEAHDVNYSGQSLTFIRMVTRVQATKSSPEKFTTLRVQSGASAHPTFLMSHSSALKTFSVWSYTPPIRDLYLSDAFPVSKVSSPKSEAPNISSLISPPTVTQLHLSHVHKV